MTAHEFFHLWNVKRIRPQGLDTGRLHKRELHHGSVVQRRRDDHGQKIIQLRAGLLDEPQYLQELASQIGELRAAAGSSDTIG